MEKKCIEKCWLYGLKEPGEEGGFGGGGKLSRSAHSLPEAKLLKSSFYVPLSLLSAFCTGNSIIFAWSLISWCPVPFFFFW